MYKELTNHYQGRITQTEQALKELRKKLYSLGTLRLLIVLATIFGGIYCPADYRLYLIGAGVILFFILLRIDNKLRKEKVYKEQSLSCDQSELAGLNYDFSAFDGAEEQIDGSHSFSLDLDIFGKKSLFQSINRTGTAYGRKSLIDWFSRPLEKKEEIELRQAAVRELSTKEEFIHHFRVHSLIHPGKPTDYQEIKEFVRSEDLIKKPQVWRALSWITPALWIILIASTALSLLPGTVLIPFYILTSLLSESLAKKVSGIQALTGKKVKTLQAYSQLMESIEQEEFSAEGLRNIQTVFTQDNERASVRFRRFTRLNNELEQRTNLAVHLIMNPLFFWDIRCALNLEAWKRKNGENVLEWIQALGEFDAYCSLGTFAYNHPDYTYPTLTNEYFKMQGEQLGHPLMRRDTCVRNDMSIGKHPYFVIITGANMAGKSTYLRTVGVNFLLACIGAPVCAENLTLYPASLVTSLRTSDSLSDNESYFFAELKRLKMIIDRLQAGEKLFIILDEILKGTNSVDKQKGSLALIEQFLRLDSCGIIATHDLLLGKLEQSFPKDVKNYRFEADIKDEELHFSYLLREGVAQNMNASFLMKKMGITL